MAKKKIYFKKFIQGMLQWQEMKTLLECNSKLDKLKQNKLFQMLACEHRQPNVIQTFFQKKKKTKKIN